MKEILSKIAKVKSEIGKLSKTAENPFFKSKYLDLNEILSNLEPLLQSHSMLLLQPIENGCVVTRIYDLDSDDILESSIRIPDFNDPQKTGSAISYYRRYSLQSLLSLQAEDDDGNKAASENKEQKKQTVNEDQSAKDLKWLNVLDKDKNFTPQWLNILKGIKSGKVKSIVDARKYFKISKEVQDKLEEHLKEMETYNAT